MVMQLNQCCCGCTLKTGSIIIGVIESIGSLVSLVLLTMYAAVATEIKNAPINEDLPPEGQENTRMILRMISTGLFAFCIVVAIICAIAVVLNILLVFGASSEKPKLVKPWLVGAVILLGFSAVIELLSIVGLIIAGLLIRALLSFVFSVIAIAIGVYMILVVNSFHNQLTAQHLPQKFSNDVLFTNEKQ